jgi:radical SAM protein with 4Fe4S-binding SPASM domain
MIVQTKLPNTEITEALYRKAGAAKIPLSGAFELSPLCNFACRMCYVRKTAKDVAESARPILRTDQWIRIAEEARDAGMLFLLLTGGEPFLLPDFHALYEKLIGMGLLVSINTNGSLIDDETVAWLKTLPPRRVNITLYGASDETYYALCGVKGAFERVDRAVTALQEAGVGVKLNGSLTPANGRDLPKLVEYAQKKKLTLELATYMFPPIRRDASQIGRNEERFSPEEAAQYRMEAFRLQNGEERYRRYAAALLRGYADPPGLDESCVDPLDGRIRCRAGKASFWVTWDGLLTPCGMMPEPWVELTGRPFSEAWRELTAVSEALRLSGICEKCPDRAICHPCAAMALAETGRVSGVPQYLCHSARAMQEIARSECDFLSKDLK